MAKEAALEPRASLARAFSGRCRSAASMNATQHLDGLRALHGDAAELRSTVAVADRKLSLVES